MAIFGEISVFLGIMIWAFVLHLAPLNLLDIVALDHIHDYKRL